LKNGDRVIFTERPSPASKNGCILSDKANIRTGWQCEEIALGIYQSRGYELLRRRWKTPFAELDLFLKSPEGTWVIVEVKSLPSTDYVESRLGRKQKMRLKRAFLWLTEKQGHGELHLALVSPAELLVFTEIFD
jgi:Holliday junction resolvase-like predicted endonuclease